MKGSKLAGAALGAMLFAAAVAAAPAPLPPPAHACEGKACIDFVDMTPRFLAFEEAARGSADADARYAVWKDKYGFAAVPPGPQGEKMARGLLDRAWPRYAAAMPAIRPGGAAIQPMALHTLAELTKLLGVNDPVTVRIVAYVGAFEDNAFTYSMGPQAVVNLPVESTPDARSLLAAHELTHAVHMQAAQLSGGWERTIAQTLLMEGLAMRATQALRPGQPDAAYVSHRPGWLEEATAKKAAILADMLPVLDHKDGQTVWRYTIDKGPAGIEREAYAAGWFVVGHLREKGMSFADIAHIPEAKMADVVRQAVAEMK